HLGVPTEERKSFPEWDKSIFTGTSKEEITAAGRAIYAFCLKVIQTKLSRPADDPLTRLAQAQSDGKLDRDEAASTLANLLIGGMEASTAIGAGIALLLTHRDTLAKLRADQQRLPGCVEEILRYESPFRVLGPRF